MSTAKVTASNTDQSVFDPTVPAPMTDVAEFGFEGRFQEWTEDARYFEYSRAANPSFGTH